MTCKLEWLFTIYYNNTQYVKKSAKSANFKFVHKFTAYYGKKKLLCVIS